MHIWSWFEFCFIVSRWGEHKHKKLNLSCRLFFFQVFCFWLAKEVNKLKLVPFVKAKSKILNWSFYIQGVFIFFIKPEINYVLTSLLALLSHRPHAQIMYVVNNETAESFSFLQISCWFWLLLTTLSPADRFQHSRSVLCWIFYNLLLIKMQHQCMLFLSFCLRGWK